MEARNFRIRSQSWLSAVLLLAVLVSLNAVLARAATRIDLTEEGLFTLADGSKAVLSHLQDPVHIKVFWQDVPRRLDFTKRYLSALLDEMQDASHGKVQSTWVDMSDASGKQEAQDLGIEPFIFSVPHGKEVREAKGYMSLAIESGDERPRVLDALSNIQDELEYMIVATIYERSRVAPPVIAFIADHPFNPFGGGARGDFNDFQKLLHRAFGSNVRTYLTLDSPIPDDVDVLILCRPRKLKPKQVYHFEQFLLRGGRGILLLDPVDVQNAVGARSRGAEPHESGLGDWMTHLGVTAERGTVGDFDAMCRFPRPRELVLYPYWPMVLPKDMDPHNPLMRSLPRMPLYWPAALSVDEAKQKAAGRKVTILATTTASGYRRGDITGLATADESPEGKTLEKVPLIALVEGPLESFWMGKPVPGSKPKDEGDKAGKDETAKKDEGAGKGTEPKKGEVAGSPDGPPAGSPDGPPAQADHGAKKSDDGAKEPDDGAKKPDDGAKKADDGAKKPDDGAKKPDDGMKADDGAKKPDDGAKKPGDGAKKPDGGAKKADDGAKKPGDGAKKPDGGAKKADDGAKKPDDGMKADDGAKKADDEKPSGPKRLEKGEVRLLIATDADMISDIIMRHGITRFNGNVGPTFVVGAAEWMSGSDELLALRARSNKPRNLDKLDDGTRNLIKHLNWSVVPFLVLVLGLIVFLFRRSA